MVMASSVGYYVRPPETCGSSRPYPEALEVRLRNSGIDAEVYNHSSWFRMIHEALPQIQGMVVPRGADVVVLNFGVLEAERTMMPTKLVRSIYRWDPTTSRAGQASRRVVLRPLHLFYKNLAPKIMRRIPGFRRLSPRRFELEMTRTIRWLRKDRNALVLVLNISPLGDNVEATLPGSQESVGQYNDIIERVVRAQGDDMTRMIDVNSAVTRTPELVQDGIHYTSEGHRVVARMLEREIVCWLKH